MQPIHEVALKDDTSRIRSLIPEPENKVHKIKKHDRGTLLTAKHKTKKNGNTERKNTER